MVAGQHDDEFKSYNKPKTGKRGKQCEAGNGAASAEKRCANAKIGEKSAGSARSAGSAEVRRKPVAVLLVLGAPKAWEERPWHGIVELRA
ncbi:hypothetical protein AGMMS50233_00460 [Endomicrobiia bacterium]|nr:hypothetical protein AGMMS50233_00460 [Endomicrobiia bacterium]